MAKQIPLSHGHFALVDEEDYESLMQSSWYYGRGYAYRTVIVNGTRTSERMHRVILAAPSGADVDHINWNTLDNRRANLRIVTHGENLQNLRGARRDSRTGVRNVILERGRYRVVVYLNGKSISCGSYGTLEDASRAASEARARHLPYSYDARSQGGES